MLSHPVIDLSCPRCREWLPIILGPDVMADFDLDVWRAGRSHPSEYAPTLSPNIFNAFATAAFRFGNCKHFCSALPRQLEF